MSLDLGWWLGAPLVGGTALAGAILTPRLRKDRNREADLLPSAGVLPVAERKRNRTTVPEAPAAGAAEAQVHATRDDTASTLVEPQPRVAPTLPKFSFRPRLGQHLVGVRNLVRRAQRGSRRGDDADERTVVDAVHDDLFDDGGGLEATGEPQPHNVQVAAPVEGATVNGADAQLAAPALAIVKTNVHTDDESLAEAGPQDTALVGAGATGDDASARARVVENGIMDLSLIPGSMNTAPANIEAWQTTTAAREAQLTEELARAQELREQAQQVLNEREAEAAAVAHQRDLERAAVVEETRVRAEARTRKWYARLDLDIDVPTLKERMLLAASLGAVKAAWAGKMLRIAFTEEEEPRVRARILGALASGDHFDDPTPFTVAFDHGGVERAAVVEVLLPRQKEASWIAELLLQLAAA